MILNAAFPEALGTFSNHAPILSLMLCMVNYHLYANACEYALLIAAMWNIYNIISISYSCHVCSARNMGTIKGEKLNEPDLWKKKKARARPEWTQRVGPDGLADL